MLRGVQLVGVYQYFIEVWGCGYSRGIPNYCLIYSPVALLLELEEGFCLALAFVETLVLLLHVVSNIWLKILGMFILPILQLSAGLFLLICMAYLASLKTCFLSWSMVLNWEMSALGWLWVVLCWKYCTSGWGNMFCDPASAWFSNIRKLQFSSGQVNW